MKRRTSLIFLLVLTLCMGCTQKIGAGHHIRKPHLTENPLVGKWTVTKCIYTDGRAADSRLTKEFIGMDSIFLPNRVLLQDQYLSNVEYESLLLTTKHFSSHYANVNPEVLGITEKELYLIRIHEGASSGLEVLLSNPTTLYVKWGEMFLQMSKVSDRATDQALDRLLASREVKS